jgi:hypothetical protein
MCSGDSRVRVIGTRKSRAFWSGSSRITPASTCKNHHTIKKNKISEWQQIDEENQKRLSGNEELHQENLILREWKSTPKLQSMVESRQGTSRLKGRREKSILGGRTKTAEENHWPKNKAGENDWRDASRQHGNRSERETRIRPVGLPSDENLTTKKRRGA